MSRSDAASVATSEVEGRLPLQHRRQATDPDRGFWMAEEVESLIADVIEISGEDSRGASLVFHGAPKPDAARRFDKAAKAARERGFDLSLLEGSGGRVLVTATPLSAEPVLRERSWWHPLLLIGTLATTTWAGALHQGINLVFQPERWTVGLPYALALLLVLGVHEMGHFLVARRRGIAVTLPYFIPAPFFLGTFGAFIRMGGRVRTRGAYFDVAVAGPLAGLLAAMLALYAGFAFETTSMGHGLDPRSSALVYAVYRVAGGVDAGLVQVGAVTFAGWLGLVVTALNLVPVGQLDGGHIAYALLGSRRAATLGALVIGLLLAGGVLYSHHLLVWGVLAWAIAGIGHPPAQNELTPLGVTRRALAYLTLAVLLAIVLPWPL